MNEQQTNQLLNVLATQAVLLHGIMNLLQNANIKNGANAAAIQFNDLQKIVESTAKSIKIPG